METARFIPSRPPISIGSIIARRFHRKIGGSAGVIPSTWRKTYSAFKIHKPICRRAHCNFQPTQAIAPVGCWVSCGGCREVPAAFHSLPHLSNHDFELRCRLFKNALAAQKKTAATRKKFLSENIFFKNKGVSGRFPKGNSSWHRRC